MKKKLSIGHYTNHSQLTGLTVFILPCACSCGLFVPGAAPALRDVHNLSPGATVQKIDALLFTGGSAFGLGAANGVMTWLAEQNLGYPTIVGKVPIVPTAALFDLAQGDVTSPSAEHAYSACQTAKAIDFENKETKLGVGIGTTVGKGICNSQVSRGGFGVAHRMSVDGIEVIAAAAVNSVGQVTQRSEEIIAGAKNKQGQWLDMTSAIINNQLTQMSHGENTTLVAIFTNVKLKKDALTRVATMASAGIANAIKPAFTPYDGDAIFAVSMGEATGSELAVGAIAAECVQDAIINAVLK